MRPGLTCLWQISGRNELGFDEWMRLDLEYIDNWSPWLDLKITLMPIPAVLMGRGARQVGWVDLLDPLDLLCKTCPSPASALRSAILPGSDLRLP